MHSGVHFSASPNFEFEKEYAAPVDSHGRDKWAPECAETTSQLTCDLEVDDGFGGFALAIFGRALVNTRMVAVGGGEGDGFAQHRLLAVRELFSALSDVAGEKRAANERHERHVMCTNDGWAGRRANQTK